MKNTACFLIAIVLIALVGCSKSKTDEGKAFMGTWKSMDDLNVKIEIKALVREGRTIENRYDLQILNPEVELPRNYIKAGQYNYQLVTADPADNYHPFQEFIHKNSMADTMAYLGLKENNTVLIRRYRYKDMPDVRFEKVE